MVLSRKELKDLVESAKNGLEIAEMLMNRQPQCRDAWLHTILEDVYCKTQKIALEYCAYQD